MPRSASPLLALVTDKSPVRHVTGRPDPGARECGGGYRGGRRFAYARCMVDAGVLGARIASSAVAPLVKKLFVKEQPGAGLVSRPVRISALVSFRREKQSVTPRDVEKVAAELVRRAVNITRA